MEHNKQQRCAAGRRPPARPPRPVAQRGRRASRKLPPTAPDTDTHLAASAAARHTRGHRNSNGSGAATDTAERDASGSKRDAQAQATHPSTRIGNFYLTFSRMVSQDLHAACAKSRS
jgi:hypothetical protein